VKQAVAASDDALRTLAHPNLAEAHPNKISCIFVKRILPKLRTVSDGVQFRESSFHRNASASEFGISNIECQILKTLYTSMISAQVDLSKLNNRQHTASK